MRQPKFCSIDFNKNFIVLCMIDNICNNITHSLYLVHSEVPHSNSFNPIINSNNQKINSLYKLLTAKSGVNIWN